MQAHDLITCVKTLGERIKEEREAHGWSQQELASRAGVSQGTIGNLESGTRKTARNLVGIAVALSVRPEWLSTGKGTKSGAPSPVADEGLLPLHEHEPELLAAFRLLDQQDRDDVMAKVRQLVLHKHEQTQAVMTRLGITRRADDVRVIEALADVPKTPSPASKPRQGPPPPPREQLLNPLPDAPHKTKRHRA